MCLNKNWDGGGVLVACLSTRPERWKESVMAMTPGNPCPPLSEELVIWAASRNGRQLLRAATKRNKYVSKFTTLSSTQTSTTLH